MKHYALCRLAALATAGFAWASTSAAAVIATGDADADTANIQNAVNAGGTVTLASGTFALKRSIVISNGVSLVGGGSKSEDVVLSLVTQTQNDGDWHVLQIAGSPDTVVSNLTVTAVSARTDNAFGPKGGVSMDSGLVVDCVIRDCVTRNNHYAGAGVNMTGGILRRCLVTGCNALDSGGAGQPGEGVYMTGGLVENCRIVGNGSSNLGYMGSAGSGGAVYVKNGVLRGCLVADNRNRVGASGVTVRENSTVESCTIAGNRQNCAEATACGVHISGANIVLRNNIIWDNTTFDGSIANFRIENGANRTFEYNDTKPPLPAGENNLSVDPQFANAAGGDYHIGYSYCCDAGFNQTWMDDAVDLDGNARVVNACVDMGCYEREAPSGFACRMNLTPNDASDLRTVAFECDYVGCPASTASEANWTFRRKQDGTAVYASGFRGSVQLPAGIWSVDLVVYGGGQSASCGIVDAVEVQASRVYANANGTGRFPYDTLENGSPSIREALQTLGEGGTLYVGAGNYVISEGINLVEGKGSRIVSLAGPERTVVRLGNVATFNNGSNDGSYGLNLACSAAYVSGLTLAAGRQSDDYSGPEYRSRGLVKMTAAGAVLTNCVFRDLVSVDRKWGTGLDMTAGTVVDSLFTRIDSFSSGGSPQQGGVLCIRGGLADRIRVVDCRARSHFDTHSGGQGDVIGVWQSGILRNSLVMHCTSEHGAPVYVGAAPGASSGGHVVNCTFVANTNAQMRAYDNSGTAHCHSAGLILNGGTVTNCIVFGNWSGYASSVSNFHSKAGTECIGYTLVDDREEDPSFVTAENRNVVVRSGAGIFRNPGRGNYSPSGNSPAINAALTLDWMDGALDLAGKPRVNRKVPDIGCYEADSQGFDVRIR